MQLHIIINFINLDKKKTKVKSCRISNTLHYRSYVKSLVSNVITVNTIKKINHSNNKTHLRLWSKWPPSSDHATWHHITASATIYTHSIKLKHCTDICINHKKLGRTKSYSENKNKNYVKWLLHRRSLLFKIYDFCFEQ